MSGPAEAAERRLHPWSWLFVLVQQLRQFVVPLLALLLFGTRRDAGGAWADAAPAIAVAVAVLVAASVWQYLTFRYRIGADRVEKTRHRSGSMGREGRFAERAHRPVRQRGSVFKAGVGVGVGKDDTLYARDAGFLDFSVKRQGRVVSVISAEAQAELETAREAAAAAK